MYSIPMHFKAYLCNATKEEMSQISASAGGFRNKEKTINILGVFCTVACIVLHKGPSYGMEMAVLLPQNSADT